MGARSRVVKTWSQALNVPYAVSLKSAQKLREANPDATPAQLVGIANRRFLTRVSGESAAVGALAVFPGAGTAVSMGSSGVQLLAFVSEAAHHCMLVAHLYGLDMRDPAKRTALVLAALTGQEGAEVISMQVDIQTLSWFRSSFLNVRSVSATEFNNLMLRWLKRRTVKSATMSTLGRMLPFGIGAVVGWGIGASLAKTTIEGLGLALGPAPEAFGSPQVIDVEVLGDEPASFAYAHLELPIGDEGERRWTD